LELPVPVMGYIFEILLPLPPLRRHAPRGNHFALTEQITNFVVFSFIAFHFISFALHLLFPLCRRVIFESSPTFVLLFVLCCFYRCFAGLFLLEIGVSP